MLHSIVLKQFVVQFKSSIKHSCALAKRGDTNHSQSIVLVDCYYIYLFPNPVAFSHFILSHDARTVSSTAT
jgi:hypothetical protein